MKKYLLFILVAPLVILFSKTISPSHTYAIESFAPMCQTRVCKLGEVFIYCTQFKESLGLCKTNRYILDGPTSFNSWDPCLSMVSPLLLVAGISIVLLTILLKIPIYLLQFKKYTKSLKPLINSNLIIVPTFLILYSQTLNIVNNIVFEGKKSFICSYITGRMVLPRVGTTLVFFIALVIAESLLLKKRIKDVPKGTLYTYTILVNLLLAILGVIIYFYI